MPKSTVCREWEGENPEFWGILSLRGFSNLPEFRKKMEDSRFRFTGLKMNQLCYFGWRAEVVK